MSIILVTFPSVPQINQEEILKYNNLNESLEKRTLGNQNIFHKFKNQLKFHFFFKELFNDNLETSFNETYKTLERDFNNQLPPGGINAE